MTDTPHYSPLDLERELVELRRARAEGDKLNAEREKLSVEREKLSAEVLKLAAEQFKLMAEGTKLDRDTRLAMWTALGGLGVGAAALVTALVTVLHPLR